MKLSAFAFSSKKKKRAAPSSGVIFLNGLSPGLDTMSHLHCVKVDDVGTYNFGEMVETLFCTNIGPGLVNSEYSIRTVVPPFLSFSHANTCQCNSCIHAED